jgi:hypothetical protein
METGALYPAGTASPVQAVTAYAKMCYAVPGLAPAHPVADMNGMSASSDGGDRGAVPCDLQQQTSLPTNTPVAALIRVLTRDGVGN